MTFDSELDAAIDRVWAMVEDVGARTQSPPGITRAAWSPEEEIAADAVRRFSREAGLSLASDPFGNLQVVPAGQAFDARAITSGSHMDTVPHGGNYDGLAGVAAGLAIVAAAQASGSRLPFRAVAMRCEESPWFRSAYLGSRLMLGVSSIEELGPVTRTDTGRTLAEHMRELGYPRSGEPRAPRLTPENTSAFFELHIEQGPLLQEGGVSVGIARAIRGNVRFPSAHCIGAYAHSAALPRRFRRDAVLAVSELALALDAYWQRRIELGDDHFVATVGIVSTDPLQHAMTKVAGEVTFSLNIGSADQAIQDDARNHIFKSAERIAAARNVRFELGEETGSSPTPIPAHMQEALRAGAATAGIPAITIPTVGHDTSIFIRAGIPGGMVLVKNDNGSHNPDESLEKEDFSQGVRVIANAMVRMARDATA